MISDVTSILSWQHYINFHWFELLKSLVANEGNENPITKRICFCSNNVELYKVLVKELAGMIERQFTGNAESRASGMVINTMGWIEGVGYDVISL